MPIHACTKPVLHLSCQACTSARDCSMSPSLFLRHCLTKTESSISTVSDSPDAPQVPRNLQRCLPLSSITLRSNLSLAGLSTAAEPPLASLRDGQPAFQPVYTASIEVPFRSLNFFVISLVHWSGSEDLIDNLRILEFSPLCAYRSTPCTRSVNCWTFWRSFSRALQLFNVLAIIPVLRLLKKLPDLDIFNFLFVQVLR